ncbi:MAG TPA: DUF2782 domain-containing protein [Casimicrobiaceae bacterium]|nr:DUF2782 domain-containing protein [Casimicrobiaceae bacterium]
MIAARAVGIVIAALLATTAAVAQVPARPDVRPPPPPPPIDLTSPPAMPSKAAPVPPAAAGQFSTETEPEPQVTRTQREENVIEEYRVKGELRYIKVTPRHGRPYYLFPQADGTPYIRRDSLDPALSVPLWALFSW